MDGLDMLGEIKQRFPDMPVMMVTAYGDREAAARQSSWEPQSSSRSPWTSIS